MNVFSFFLSTVFEIVYNLRATSHRRGWGLHNGMAGGGSIFTPTKKGGGAGKLP